MPFFTVKYKENSEDCREWHLCEHKNEDIALAYFNLNDAMTENIGEFTFGKEGAHPYNSEYVFYEYERCNGFLQQTGSQFIYTKD